MALEIRRSGNQSGGPSLTADRRLYLATDGVTVVEESDPRAALLLAGAGCEIPIPDAQRYRLSLVDGRVVQERDATAEPKRKEAPKPEDKQAAPPAENKAAQSPAKKRSAFRAGG